MPHIIVEYSPNLEHQLDMSAFCDLLRRTAATIDALPMPGIRVRAMKVDHYSIADGNKQHGFIDVSLRLRAGRSMGVRKEAIETLFEAAREFVSAYMSEHSLALSFEVRNIDADLSPKCGSIRDHL
ncbi:MAG: hypothetical protein AB8B84_12645 [Granulosicoccus sp.]